MPIWPIERNVRLRATAARGKMTSMKRHEVPIAPQPMALAAMA